MKDEARKRLARLRDDYELGQAKLHEIEQQAVGLREALLRISGAIQVLEELLTDNSNSQEPAAMKVP